MISLADYIAQHLSTPFKWGINDCVSFAVGYMQQASGRVLLPAKLWRTELQAARLIKRHGGLVAALDLHLTRLPHPNLAHDGDVAMAAGVVSLVVGPHLVAPGKDGLVFKPRTEAEHAWTM